MSARRPWWREPALHFTLLGAAVFALDAWRRPRHDPHDVTVAASLVRGLRDDHQRRYGREPTRDELRAETERFVREEVLYREALAMGLERGDVIVRRRLVQKMEFFLEDVAPLAEPSDDALTRYMADHAARYAAPPRVTLRHVFFDRGRRGATLDADARTTLAALHQGADPAGMGDPFVSGASYVDAELQRVAADLGSSLAELAQTAALDTWQGPVASPYGLHLLRVTSRSTGGARVLDAVRAQVLADWRTDARERANRDAYARVLEGYHVRVEGL